MKSGGTADKQSVQVHMATSMELMLWLNVLKEWVGKQIKLLSEFKPVMQLTALERLPTTCAFHNNVQHLKFYIFFATLFNGVISLVLAIFGTSIFITTCAVLDRARMPDRVRHNCSPRDLCKRRMDLAFVDINLSSVLKTIELKTPLMLMRPIGRIQMSLYAVQLSPANLFF